MIVSDRIAPSSITAVGRLGSIPFWRKRSITSVAVEPTGSNVARTGMRVSIEPMWWWSRISTISACSTPGTLCACSAWSTSTTRRGLRTYEVTVRDEADRPARLVDAHGRVVVDVLDVLGDVGEQVVGPHGERLAVHQRARRGRQRDHAAADVGVQRRAGDRGAVLARQLEHLVGRHGLVAGHHQRDADLDRPALRVLAVADDHYVALVDVGQRFRVHRQHPHTAADLTRGVAGYQLAREHLDDRADRGRGVELRRAARLADVAAREHALGHHARERAVGVDERDQVALVARHPQAHRAHRVVLAGQRHLLIHHVAHAQQHVGEELRRRRLAAVEHPARLRVEVAEAHRHVVVVRVQAPEQLRVADRRGDRIGVGVAVAGDVDRHSRAF